MKNGKCIKCGKDELYTNKEKLVRGHHATLHVGFMSNISLYSIVCINCGYSEDYVDEQSLDKLKDKLDLYSPTR